MVILVCGKPTSVQRVFELGCSCGLVGRGCCLRLPAVGGIQAGHGGAGGMLSCAAQRPSHRHCCGRSCCLASAHTSTAHLPLQLLCSYKAAAKAVTEFNETLHHQPLQLDVAGASMNRYVELRRNSRTRCSKNSHDAANQLDARFSMDSA